MSYAVGILRNHPFFDGNKRAAFIALNIFLNLNGLRLKADTQEAADIFLTVAGGKMNEESLVAWILMHTLPRTE